ncbi:cellulose biosynthesis cyclic di-GMP-binding regulatory protein BcsB [Paenibacillus sp. 1P03SA]|uniref:cellulose biosynthesis cyclic di-GMP-binding regulatory protein BcsB n=1 Tax=Paenibacillus sp. 1P03SA TaxID=3132294 RepID=UPI0039A0AD00
MMTMKKWLLFICLLSIFAAQFGQGASAAPANGEARTYQTPFTESEASLSGAVSSRQKYFELMDYWNVETVKINLDYQATQLAKELISSVTLSVNGHAFHSFRPVAADNGRQRLSVSVPKEWLKKGSNMLEIAGYIRTVDNEVCAPDDAPDHWLSLFTTSSIDVAYTNAGAESGHQRLQPPFRGAGYGRRRAERPGGTGQRRSRRAGDGRIRALRIRQGQEKRGQGYPAAALPGRCA